MSPPERMLVVWCPDWSVVAAGVTPDRSRVAVLRANRVVACSPAAREEGVGLQQRRRDAQARCPDLEIVDDDPARDARAFEPVVAALGRLTPRLSIARPGCCVLPTRGPSRYHGGDRSLAELALQIASDSLEQRVPVGVGVADGVFAATLAARKAAAEAPPTRGNSVRSGEVEAKASGPWTSLPRESESGRYCLGWGGVELVEVGGSAGFLAPLSVSVLDRPELVDVLVRLGIRSLGELAALPTSNVVGRFGAEGAIAHRLANGLDERPPVTEPPPPDLRVAIEIDPPAERVETAAFVARGLADDLAQLLGERGSACTRLAIGAETEHGERHERVWSTEGTFSPGAIADRLRWQLEGWLQQGVGRPTGGITLLWLVPDEVVPAGGRQLVLATTGGVDDVAVADRANRALARVQGVVGSQGVLVPEWQGGRGPGEQVVLVPAGGDLTEPRPAVHKQWVAEPWPGKVPPPSPAVVHPKLLPVDLRDAEGQPLRVSGRGQLSAEPAVLAVGRSTAKLTAWAGPWPCEERWWDRIAHRRRARMQVVTENDVAHLLILEAGRWSLEATYD